MTRRSIEHRSTPRGDDRPGEAHMYKFMAAVVLIIAIPVATAGCVSTGAQVARQEFALESEMRNRDNADAQRRDALTRIEVLTQLEIERLQRLLVTQNERAGGNVERVAQNYIDYYGALDELRRRVANEHEKAASLHAEQIQLGRGYRMLSRMADEELRISRELAGQTLAEARRVAEELWRQYQIANPPALPEPEAPVVTETH